MTSIDSRISGLYKLPVRERIARLKDVGCLGDADAQRLLDGKQILGLSAADKMIENVIGVFGLPLAIAPNFVVNSRETMVPLVVEEPSIVAALSSAAALARHAGGFVARADESLLAAQVHVVNFDDADRAEQALLSARDELIEMADSVHPRLPARGGGVANVEVRKLELPNGAPLLAVHVLVDTCDAMGANLVNTIAEALSPRIAELTGGRAVLRILSNLTDRSLVRASVGFSTDLLADGEMNGAAVRDRIVLCNEIASVDPYRAATHNKGIFNGIDALAIATGNDWRAIEAGGHAYAAIKGSYTSLTRWAVGENGDLVGTLELPLKPGVVGGTVNTNPGAELGLAIAGADNARQLAELMAAVGLAQNFAALRALATHGIQQGHMRLHARSVASAAGATDAAIDDVVERMVASGEINPGNARKIVAEFAATRAAKITTGKPAAQATTSTAAGKVILFGEHAAVYGRHALALPIPDAIRATASEGTQNTIISVAEWDLRITVQPDAGDVAEIVMLILQRLGVADRCFDIRLSAQIPRGMGLGSSAAVAVAITRAVAACVGQDVSAERVNDIAFDCEAVAHGNPSGIDNTVSCFAAPILFRQGLAPQESLLKTQRLPPLVLGFATSAGHTADMVAGVRARYDRDTKLFDAVFDQVDELSRKGSETLLAGQYDVLGHLMNVCHGLLNAIGVSTPELETMVQIARDAGAAGAKLTGAGGGGAIVALCPGTAAAVTAAFGSYGYETLALQVPEGDEFE